jgi:hypothetical protein
MPPILALFKLLQSFHFGKQSIVWTELKILHVDFLEKMDTV